jgi:TolA-binding protein
MNYATNTNSPTPQKDNRKVWYSLLIGLLAITWGYIIYDKNKTKEVIIQKDIQYVNVSNAKDSLQILYNVAAARVDSITETKIKLEGSLAEKNNDIIKLKSNIRAILNKKNASDEDLKQAREQITQLNGKIDDLFSEINKLKGENQQLSTANQQLSTEKKGLEDNLSVTQSENKNLNEKVDVASTLHASNINVTAVQVKKSGKQKETSTAKHADMFVIGCDIDENRVTASGTKSLYVIVYNPDGTPSATSGTFKLRDGNDKPFTNKIDVNYEQGKTLPVSFTWKPDDKFQTGEYKIEIYNNGFKIGEGIKSLKKSTFLGL